MPLNYVRSDSARKYSMTSYISDKNILVQFRYRIYIIGIVSHILQFEKIMNMNKVRMLSKLRASHANTFELT